MDLTRRSALSAGIGLALGKGPGPAPRRVVSLNPCLDAILLDLADRQQIAALSHLARSPESTIPAPVAWSLPQTWETAEEVLLLRPDLVLASTFTPSSTRKALARQAIPLALFGLPPSVAASLDQIRHLARLLHQPDRGAALVYRIEAALAAAAPPPGHPPVKALILQSGGFSPGSGTLADEMLQKTGFENMAPHYGTRSWQKVELEQILANPPQVLLTGTPQDRARSLAAHHLDHPALEVLKGRMLRADFPQALLNCAGPTLIMTAERLARIRNTLPAGLA